MAREQLAVPKAEFRSYYGRQILKSPVWNWMIAAYLFCGGLSAGSAMLAAGADLTGRPGLRKVTRIGSLVGILASMYFLVADLGRPERFHHHGQMRAERVRRVRRREVVLPRTGRPRSPRAARPSLAARRELRPTGSPTRARRPRPAPRPGRPAMSPTSASSRCAASRRPFSSTSSVAFWTARAADLQRARAHRAHAARDLGRVGLDRPARRRAARRACRTTSCAYAVSWPWPCEEVPAVHRDRAVVLDLAGAELGAEAGPLDVGAEPDAELHDVAALAPRRLLGAQLRRSPRWPAPCPAPSS